MPPIVIHTPRMVLRPLRESDRSGFVRMHEVSREHFGRWSPVMPPGQTLDQFFAQQLERTEATERDGSGMRRVGVLADGSVVGIFNLDQIFRGPFLNCYAGWKVSVEHCGRGLATEGVLGLLDAAFTPEPAGLGLHRVQANVIPSNGASLRVAEKCGFRREGLAKRYLKIAGVWQDHVMFGKVVEEHTLANQTQ